MYSAIARNKRNTVFIILLFLLIIGGLGALVAWYFNDWSIAIIVFVVAGLYAWFQYFDNGSQGNFSKDYEGRCRAVRRFLII